MKKIFLFSIFILVIFSCKKEEKDDSYKYLFDKMKQILKRDRNISESNYLQNYYNIKNDDSKRKRFDSLYKISLEIEKGLTKLDFSKRESVFKFRDSVIKVFNLPLNSIKEKDYLKLNDSVFKMKIESDILDIRECFHFLKIYDRKEPL